MSNLRRLLICGRIALRVISAHQIDVVSAHGLVAVRLLNRLLCSKLVVGIV